MEQLKDLGFSIQKSILEVRYDRTFLFDEVSNLNKIVKDLRREFPHSKRNEDGSLALINPNEKNYTVIMPERGSIISDQKTLSHSSFKTKSSRTINSIVSFLDIDRFTRVGLRTYYGINFKKQGQPNAFIRDKFLKLKADTINNPHINFSLQEDNLGINVSIHTASSMDINIDLAKKTVENLLIFDIDIFTGEIVPNALNGFLKEAISRAENKVAELYTTAKNS